MIKINYQEKMEKQIQSLTEKKKLLLHACCAPCSSYVLEQLSPYFDITIYYYNPNIFPEEEFEIRYRELEKLVKDMQMRAQVVKAPYENDQYEKTVADFKKEAEGGVRCFLCYELRLDKAAAYAKKHGYDYFTTTLSISPYKNAPKLNEIGEKLEQKYGISYLYADFKKKNGYKRSIELSLLYKLYRQDYCGCIYSKRKKV